MPPVFTCNGKHFDLGCKYAIRCALRARRRQRKFESHRIHSHGISISSFDDIFFFVLFYDVLFSSAPVCGFLFDIKRIFFWFDMRIAGIDDRCLRRHCAFAHDTENQLLYRVTSECVIDELINTLMSELGRVWGKRREIIRKYFIELCISVCMTVCDVEEELLCSFSNVTRIAAFV